MSKWKARRALEECGAADALHDERAIAGITWCSMANKDERLYELDGLRGWAVLSVFMSHAVGLVPDGAVKKSLESTPLHFLWDGAAAVFLFLALSGFVLALPFVSSTFLGETSYSFYLLHFPVLWLAASFFFPMTGSIIIPAAVAVTVSYLLSYLVYRYLEMPMHQAGRSLSNWMKPKLQREQAQEIA